MTLIDKIKGLENQLEYQNKRVKKLREENEELRAAIMQNHKAMDATLVSIALRYGGYKKESAENILIFGEPNVDKLNEYKVSAEKDDLGMLYVTVSRRGENAT